MSYMRYFFLYIQKKIFHTKIFPGELIWWFSIGFIRVGAILDPFLDPFWPNTSGAAMKWMHFEVSFSQFTSFSIGFTIESVQSDLSFCSEITF